MDRVFRSLQRLLLLLGLATAWMPNRALAEPLTLELALQLAEQNARTLHARRLETRAARDDWRSTMAQLGPRLQTDFNYQHWDQEIRFQIDVPPEFQSLMPSVDSVIRQQDTYTASVSVIQPLTPLVTIGLASRLAALGVDQAVLQEIRDRRRIRLQTIDVFFGLIKARHGLAALESVRAATEQHLQKAGFFFEQGLLKKDDLLRIEVQRDRVIQGLELTRVGAEVLASQLALLVGRPLQSHIELIEPDRPQPLDEDLETCIVDALDRRPEIRQVRLAADMARFARDIRIMDFVPQAVGLFNYTRTRETQFTTPESWFLGINVSWTPWEWGKTFFATRAAQSRLDAARAGLGDIEDLVRLEVKSLWLSARTSHGNIERAGSSVAQARENLRIQTERFAQNMNTTTDILDAETLLLQAENDLLSAVHEFRVAREKLLDSMGR
jgi:outer membrane protein TolC